jgi:hypothetical protein
MLSPYNSIRNPCLYDIATYSFHAQNMTLFWNRDIFNHLLYFSSGYNSNFQVGTLVETATRAPYTLMTFVLMGTNWDKSHQRLVPLMWQHTLVAPFYLHEL